MVSLGKWVAWNGLCASGLILKVSFGFYLEGGDYSGRRKLVVVVNQQPRGAHLINRHQSSHTLTQRGKQVVLQEKQNSNSETQSRAGRQGRKKAMLHV